MNKLLNRFAWLLSLSFGFIISFIFIGSDSYRLNSDEIIISAFAGLFLGLLIKRFFLGKKFIEDRIYHFAKTLKKLTPEKVENVFQVSNTQNNFDAKDIVENIDLSKNIKNETEEIEDIENIKEDSNAIVKNNLIEKIPEQKYEPTVFDIYLEKIGKYIKEFFSTNIIAKIGAIILFFVVSIFLAGPVLALWYIIGPVGRIILGFIISGIIFYYGIKLDKKGLKKESMILIGLSILLNYLIILAGRYIIGENLLGDDGFLSSGVTFILLILNTIFGIVTSLVYNSKTLLIFSFLFAYINPFIIGANSDGTPYVLIGYSFLISLGALFISKKNSSFSLFIISFIFGNLLFLVAPYTSNIDWVFKFIFSAVLSVIAIYLSKYDDKYKKSTLFLFIGAYIFLIFNLLNSGHNFSDGLIFGNIAIISFILVILSFIFSFKKNLVHLFYIGTLGTIALISPIIYLEGDTKNYGIILIIIFAILNWILPFINERLLKKQNFYSLITGSLAGVLFVAFQIYSFGEKYFPGVVEGFAFLGLAIVYFIQSFFIVQKIGIEKMKNDDDLKNIFYSFAGISISLFSIAIAFVFSAYPEIITTTWLFEATILYYFYSKNNSSKIFFAATVLFIIGLIKFGILLDVVKKGDFIFLISFIIILASFILNLFFINKSTENNNSVGEIFHSILHIIGMSIMGGLLLEIIPSSGHGWSMLGISVFITILGGFYAKFNINFLKYVFIILITLFSLIHIGEIDNIFYRLDNHDKSYLKILQYLVSAILISNIYIWNKFNIKKGLNKVILIILAIYAFIVSNIFVYEFFGEYISHYSLTLYWGAISSFLLFKGIGQNIPKLRTIGLYFLVLTSLKIFFYDIWEGMSGDSVFVVLGLIGVIFIVISTKYTKKYGNDISKEFSIKNLYNNRENNNSDNLENNSNKNKKIDKINNNNEEIKKEEETDNGFMIKLKKIDISDVKVVRFFPINGDSFTIRAKNLQRLVVIITKKFNKNIFKAGELNDIYNNIISNYKSELSRREYDKIRTAVKDFIDKGGSVEIIKK